MIYIQDETNSRAGYIVFPGRIHSPPRLSRVGTRNKHNTVHTHSHDSYRRRCKRYTYTSYYIIINYNAPDAADNHIKILVVNKARVTGTSLRRAPCFSK